MTPTDNIRKAPKKPARKATVKSSSQSAPAAVSTDAAAGVDGPVDERGGRIEGAAFPIVGIGASAGGLEAFQQLLRALPADTGMAFVLVQHLAPSHASALSEILARATTMPVREVEDGSRVEPNHVYVIPPGQCMAIAGGALRLAPRESVGHYRVIDHFFRALAEELKHQAIGVVLSGTANDGTTGLEAIKADGGITFAQDDTAQHDGMPYSAIASGCVDFVLPPDDIAREIARIGRHPYAVPEPSSRKAVDAPNLADILQLLRHGTGVDFTDYKFNTLYRRITRRMVLLKMDTLTDYVHLLRRDPAEVEALYQDVLIGVTSFFRDPEAFEALKDHVFTRLIKDRSRYEPVRIWTLGCSTGQEAYSLAIAFTEFAQSQGSTLPLQVFATDLNAIGIDYARAGIYPKTITQEVSPERLRSFFVETDGGYRISKAIRDVCVFSRHNALSDPPFSRIDFISCRNLLIYLEPVLQQKIVPMLHYALKPSGCLWLGSAETIGGYRNLFEAQDAKHKIYTKRPGDVPAAGHFPLQQGGAPRREFTPIAARPPDGGTHLYREADRILLTKFAPPGVLVSADLDILQYRGDTGAYLTPMPGKASLSLLKMLREGLLVAVRAAVLRADKGDGSVREEGLRVKANGGYREVAIEVIPVKADGATPGGFLILFEDATRAHTEPSASVSAPPEPPAINQDNTRLTQELEATREYLQAVIEQQEAANEELQSANEEVQSANEELQSTNEELETSKEEIQSSNEELATVNDELNNRNAELTRSNNDLGNVLDSADMAIVLLGPDLRVRRFTKTSEKILNLTGADVGRPIGAIKLNIEIADLETLLAHVMDTVTSTERDVRDNQGRWYSLRLRPYRTQDNRIDGAVLMLVDVDLLKRAQAYTESIVATVRGPLLVLDAELRVRTANRAFFATFQTALEEIDGRLLYELGDGEWNIPALRVLLEDVLPQDHQVNDFTVEHEFARIGQKTMLLNARRLVQADGEAPLILLAFEDVSEPMRAVAALRDSEAKFRALAEASPGLIWLLDPEGKSVYVNQRYLEYFGTTTEDVLGGGWLPLLHPDDSSAYVAAVAEAQRTRGYLQHRVRVGAADGDWRWIESHALPLFGADGDYAGHVGISLDVNEATIAVEELRESKARLEFTLESAKVGDWDLDLANDTSQRSLRHDQAFGYDKPVEHWGFEIFIQHVHPEDRAEVERLFRDAVTRQSDWHFECRVIWPNGSVHWIEAHGSVYRKPDGKPAQMLGIVANITERKETEEALRHMASELRGHADDLLEADRRKNEFLAMLAHELRNPLAPIRNALESLRISKGDGDALQTASQMMGRQVAHLVRLVDDLLDVSRVSRGRIELRREPLELASVVKQAAEAARPGFEYRGQNLTVALPSKVYVNGDPTRLAQVIGNLLNNACKFTDEGGRISLAVSHEDDEAVIRVKDSGIGIVAGEHARIFEMFTQVDTSLERPTGGLGIGLTLVKTLVELHDGTVEVHSEGAGQGSEFVVRLPIAGESIAPSPEPQVSKSATMTAQRILVVDDNRDAAESLAQLLEYCGHETHIAVDGLEAVAAAASFRPDVVLLDIGLPKLNGYAAARRIREQAWSKDMVLVALTGWGQEEDRRKSSEAGFNAHLVKPVDPATLLRVLAESRPGSAAS